MSYLGNPKMVLMQQDSIPCANFEYPTDPTTTINPVRVPVSWLNTVTGVLWVCTDNTTDANVWKGQGVAQSEPEAFAPTTTWVSNVTWAGQKWRIGNLLYMQVRGVCTGAPTAANLNITLPDSLEYDQTIFGLTAFDNGPFSYVVYSNFGTATSQGKLINLNATELRFVGQADAPSTVSETSPFSFNTDDEVNLYCAVPISGWSVQDIIS